MQSINIFAQLSAAAMRPCDPTATKRLLPPSESQSDVKKSKRSPETPWSSKSKTNINDLHDSVLVEILYRLPHYKFVFQSKCVCKRWFSLVSNEKFHRRFLWLQGRQNRKLEPVGRTLIFRNSMDKREFFILPELELPMLKTDNFSLRFLPCFEAPEYIETDDDIGDEPIVVGTCNDLLLCCETVIFQRNYYICNPYTKQFVRLPPAPRRHMEVRVGFICDPYYNEDDDDKEKESNIGDNTMIQVNVDFRYAIVRIAPLVLEDFYQYEFNVEIFSSETGEWRELVVRSPHSFCLESLTNTGGVAYNGMLYWWSAHEHFIVGLDPYSSSNKDEHSHRFRFIYTPNIYGGIFPFLSVCRGGRLRICNFFPYNIHEEIPFNYHSPLPFSYESCGISRPSLIVWELKDDGNIERGGGNWCNLTGNISFGKMVLENPLLRQWGSNLIDPIRMLAFDPNNEDILYLELFGHLVTCNIRERKLKETTLITPYKCVVDFGRGVFPFMLTRWPTPLPRLILD